MEDRYERDAEAFLEGITREHYLATAGLKERYEVAPLFVKYGWLFTADAVRSLLSRREDKRMLHLAEFGVEYYLENGVKALSEETTNAMLQATVPWEGKELPYRSAPIVVANEADPARRHELQRRILDRTAEFNPRLLERLRQMHEGGSRLGYGDFVALWDELAQLSLAPLADQMRSLLRATADAYYPQLDRLLPTVGVTRDDAETSDISHLFRATAFDAIFPKEKLVSALRQTLAGLGIDVDAQANLRLDVEARPLKSPRAFCAPIRVPDEVVLVIMPRGGQDDYSSIMHEAGHAEHYANVAPDLPFAYKYLGDNSVTEAYAMLLESVVYDPAWLGDVLGATDTEAYLRHARFHKVYMLRRYASKLLYELQLHRSDGAGMADVYSSLLGGNLGVRVAPENYLVDVDDNFYAARYLRAWMLEVQLRRRLRKTYGARWFASREAGRFLSGLWREGQRRNADELARDLGYSGLDVGPLLEELAGGQA